MVFNAISGKFSQHLIANGMTIGIVDVFEMITVEHKRRAGARSGWSGGIPIPQDQSACAVIQPGKRIGYRQFLHFTKQARVFDGDGYIGAQ